MINFVTDGIKKSNVKIDFDYINSLYLVKDVMCTVEQDLKRLRYIFSELMQFNTLIVFGIGGSCLGGKLASLFGENNKKIKFYDTIDESILISELEVLNLKDTAVLFVSKSGSTLETILQYEIAHNLYKNRIVDFQKNFFFIVGEGSYLNSIAVKIDAMMTHFDEDVGGRYSCFTESTLIPAMFKNVNVLDYIQGAIDCVNDFNNKKTDLMLSLQAAIKQAIDKTQFTLLSYSQKLEVFNAWYAQLISESSGKDGTGVTPITAIGTRDQHSMLQLFLDGQNDKFHTVIAVKPSQNSYKINIEDERFSYLNNYTIAQVLHTNAIATYNALKIKKRAVRLIELDELNAYSIGYLNMYFIIENILICNELCVDPFDQPAVEIIKKEVKNILSL
ncbi:MAG: phosphoglucose isomerase [Pseudomonadota bacterium]|jgi:glucose-6-phosphate isomerase